MLLELVLVVAAQEEQAEVEGNRYPADNIGDNRVLSDIALVCIWDTGHVDMELVARRAVPRTIVHW